MKLLSTITVLLALFVISCNTPAPKTPVAADSLKLVGNPTITKSETPVDSTKTDTVMHGVNIDGNVYTITIQSERYDEHHELITFDNEDFVYVPFRMVIINEVDRSVALLTRFTENYYEFFKKDSASLDARGKLYISVWANWAGPGIDGAIYYVTSDAAKRVQLIKVCDYGESTMLAIGKDDNSFLKAYRIWNMDENETRWDDHRYELYKYTLKNGKYIETKIGKTKNKYTAEPESMKVLLEDFIAKEPRIMQSVSMNDYVF